MTPETKIGLLDFCLKNLYDARLFSEWTYLKKENGFHLFCSKDFTETLKLACEVVSFEPVTISNLSE